MQTRVDEDGNVIIVVDSAPKAAPKKRTKSLSLKANDATVAIQAMEKWGKPLAHQAGNMWTYSPDTGWTICTDQFQCLCNELRGSNTERTIMKIVEAKVRVPDLEQREEYSTYWELEDGEWTPFHMTHSQVLFSNGLLDLSDMSFTPTNRRVIYGPRVSIPFDPQTGFDKRCEEFQGLLAHALPDIEQREYLQALCGLILQPHVILRGQLVFRGVPHSGKTTLATAIASAPGGIRGQSAICEKKLCEDKWATNMLVNKFCSVSNDSGFSSKWEDFMKGYTSGSYCVEPKYGKPVTVPTTAKLVSTCNEMQEVKDPSGAAEMRYRVFRFLNPIADTGRSEQTQFMSAAYWATPERRAGIVSWMLEGLVRVIEHGLVEPESMKQTKREAIYEANPAMEFVANQLEADPKAFLETSALIEAMGDSDKLTTMQLPKLIHRIWGVSKSRLGNKRGYPGLKIKEA